MTDEDFDDFLDDAAWAVHAEWAAAAGHDLDADLMADLSDHLAAFFEAMKDDPEEDDDRRPRAYRPDR